MRRIFIGILFLGLIGCVTTHVPGQTIASPQLQSDIVYMIKTIENAQAPKCSHRIIDTKADRIEGDIVYENWIVESCGKELVYPVNMTSDPKGGSYFGVTTPKREQGKK